jgi:hypothetical protein
MVLELMWEDSRVERWGAESGSVVSDATFQIPIKIWLSLRMPRAKELVS